jgi:phosphatidylinositol alpha-1,6-mannosyltransferase
VNGALLVTRNFPPKLGGTATHYSNLYRFRKPEEVAILAGKAAGSDDFDRQYGREIVRRSFEPRSWLKPFEWVEAGLRRFPDARRMLKRRGFKEIHCGTTFPEGVVGVLAKRWSGTRFVLWVLGEDAEFFRNCRVEAPLQRAMLRQADRVITISENSARICRELGATDANLRLVPPGVELSSFKPNPEGARQARDRHGVKNDEFLLVTVGRLQKRKGHDKVILAMPEILARHPTTKYLIVGDSTGAPASDADDLRKLVESLGLSGSVTFVGAVPASELAAYYSAGDLFVMPNRQIGGDVEGFGITFIEAAACGKACIAGDSGGAVDAVLHERTGLLVDGRDERAVAAAVLRLIDDRPLRSRLSQAALVRADEFAWHRIHERFEAALVD